MFGVVHCMYAHLLFSYTYVRALVSNWWEFIVDELRALKQNTTSGKGGAKVWLGSLIMLMSFISLHSVLDITFQKMGAICGLN